MVDTERDLQDLLDELTEKQEKQRRNAMLYIALPLLAGLALTFWTAWQANRLAQIRQDIAATARELILQEQKLRETEEILARRDRVIQSFYQSPHIGETLATVPDVEGRQLPEANDILTEYGLRAETVVSGATDLAPGTIVKQDPEPGKRVRLLSPVRLVVAGSRVPSVVGIDLEEAKKILAPYGLELVVAGKSSSWVQAGIVIAQTPAAGTSVAAGARITVWISSGYR